MLLINFLLLGRTFKHYPAQVQTLPGGLMVGIDRVNQQHFLLQINLNVERQMTEEEFGQMQLFLWQCLS